MDALSYILDKYSLHGRRSPVEIPNTGRDTLAALFGELGFKVGAEIGTERGKYAEMLCSSNPGVKLYCVDTYRLYSGYRDYNEQQKLDNAKEEAAQRLAPYNVEFIYQYSMNACLEFADGSLDFVYIDANHEWPFVTHDIYYWSRKVRQGGIVSGHDYYMSKTRDSRCHVKAAVNGYTYGFMISPWFILGTRGIYPGQIRDKSRSYFWVKDERQP